MMGPGGNGSSNEAAHLLPADKWQSRPQHERLSSVVLSQLAALHRRITIPLPFALSLSFPRNPLFPALQEKYLEKLSIYITLCHDFSVHKLAKVENFTQHLIFFAFSSRYFEGSLVGTRQ